MRIKVGKPSTETIAEMKNCPTWSKEASIFDWEYDATETCYVMEGEVKVTTPEGEAVEFGPGDLVTFPRGLKCTCDVASRSSSTIASARHRGDYSRHMIEQPKFDSSVNRRRSSMRAVPQRCPPNASYSPYSLLTRFRLLPPFAANSLKSGGR